MKTTNARTVIEQIRPPSIEPGSHMDVLELCLRSEFKRQRSALRWNRYRGTWVALLLLFITGLGLATAPFVSRIRQTVAWGETTRQYLVLKQVPEKYRSELADKWERGEGILHERIDAEATIYRAQFTFSDGHTQLVTALAPPDPAKRRELKRLVSAGQGDVVGTIRNAESGFLTYRNRYTLSDGEQIIMIDQWPPLAPQDEENARSFIGTQMKQGAGIVVGQTKDGYVVEYQLPDGRPVTQFSSTAPASLTPEREQEIEVLRSAGQGRLIQRILTAEGWAFLVEYELSDGSMFRIGYDHPPMPDAEWVALSSELVAKLGAENYIEETITGTDGRPVTVLTVELSNGETFQIPKTMRDTVVRGQ